MPAVSKKQQKFMGAELARKRAGKKTRTGMSAKQLKEFASTPRRGLPTRKKARTSRAIGTRRSTRPKVPRGSLTELLRKRQTKR